MKKRKLKLLTSTAIVYYNKVGKSLSYYNIRYPTTPIKDWWNKKGYKGEFFEIITRIWKSVESYE